MKRLTYTPRNPRSLLDEAGQLIAADEQFTTSDERAEQLIADPHVQVQLVISDALPKRITRGELDELARKAGINPEDYTSKADLIGALQHTEHATQAGSAHTTEEAPDDSEQ